MKKGTVKAMYLNCQLGWNVEIHYMVLTVGTNGLI